MNEDDIIAEGGSEVRDERTPAEKRSDAVKLMTPEAWLNDNPTLTPTAIVSVIQYEHSDGTGDGLCIITPRFNPPWLLRGMLAQALEDVVKEHDRQRPPVVSHGISLDDAIAAQGGEPASLLELLQKLAAVNVVGRDEVPQEA